MIWLPPASFIALIASELPPQKESFRQSDLKAGTKTTIKIYERQKKPFHMTKRRIPWYQRQSRFLKDNGVQAIPFGEPI
jgi:hypothetical protein